MTDGEFPEPPEGLLQPEYPGGETHPSVRRDELTEPWLGAVAGYLGDRDFGHDFASGRRYDAPEMMRAFVYQRIAGLDSYHALASHLEARPRIAAKLGIAGGVPSADTFREWWKGKLDEQLRETTETVVERHFKPALADYLLDLGFVEGASLLDLNDADEPEPKDITPGQKQSAIEHIRPLVYDMLDFDRADNASYHRTDMLDLQAEVSREQDYVQKTVEQHWDRGEEMLTPRAYFGAVQNRSAEEWSGVFRQVYDRQIEAAKGAGMLDRPVDVYIDETIIPFWERKAGLPEGVRGGEQKNGTYYGYHWATISAHDGGRSVLLGSAPVQKGDKTKDTVEYLVNRASEHVNISGVFMDSGFSGADLLTWLDTEGYEFTVQYPKRGKRIKTALAQMTGKFDTSEGYYVRAQHGRTRLEGLTVVGEPDYNNVDGDFDFSTNTTENQAGLGQFGGGMDFGAVDIDDIDKRHYQGRRAYLTNRDIDGEDAEEVIRRYKRRWTIETKYRIIKQEFLGKTTSRDYSVRTFYWLFACMLYNAWVLLDVFLRADHPDLVPEDRPVVPARTFARQFFEVEYG